MSNQNTFHCIVDDTTLTTNLDEIGPWVQNGAINLIVPLYTLERLHLLKKDASQLGQSARKAVKLLDQSADLPHSPIIIQGFDDQYTKWSLVEKRYTSSVIQRDETGAVIEDEGEDGTEAIKLTNARQTAFLSSALQDLSLSEADCKTSPVSTPPLSPVVSDPQSTKTSPEVRCATISKHEATPVPPTLKALINYVVWYTYESGNAIKQKNLIFLTNSADAAQIAKDFGVVPKTIHQLRASIGTSGDAARNSTEPHHKKKRFQRTNSFKHDSEPKTLFRYDEASSDEEELVFKPRSRDPVRPGSAGRVSTPHYRGRGAHHSPSNSMTAAPTPASKPQVPVEEIDPDSFDRGTFARGSTPLANVGNFYGPSNNHFGRGGQRNFSSPNPRGGGGYRGNTFRGRGRGRLFVP